ncbi:MAG: hypothetical protein LBK47_06605 [Prevotellaceae bacterium]|jgi:hypothetical protein|nr:hypothetical protein [Prevotellaceae bacterium]
MNNLKKITLYALLGMAYSSPAQMVVTNPTQDIILLESKIETASSWLQQLDGLMQTIQLARAQAAKLDSSKRAVEKAYQLQEEVRRDAVNKYNAVKNMSVDNLAHVTESYLGFSINPADYLPDMPGLEGYTEFQKAISYDARSNINDNTASIDRFLSGLVLTDSSAIIDNPTYDYFRKLNQINNLAGAYGSFKLYREKAALDRRLTIDIPKSQASIDFLKSLLDSVDNPADLIALWNAILAEEARLKAEREKALELAEEQLNAAARVTIIQDIAEEKQKDIVVMTAAIMTHYNLNKNFSLRKLAASAANKAKTAEVKRKAKEDMSKLNKR